MALHRRNACTSFYVPYKHGTDKGSAEDSKRSVWEVGGKLWSAMIKSKVFTNIQRKGKEKLQKKYPNINFTTSGRTTTKPKFPNVYIKKMQGKAIGQTLEDAKVNGVLSSFQIDVTTNTNQNEADNVADVIADIMIDMGYDMVGDPFPDDSEDVYRNTSRWQRPIGYNDILNF